MANENRQNGLIRYFPDRPFFRRLASRTKIRMTYRTALPESWIAEGERSAADRRRVLERCRRKWPAAAERLNGRIDEALRSVPAYREEGADPEEIREDMLFSWFARGFEPNEYAAFRLDRKTPEETERFISGRLRMKYRCQMNNLLKAHYFNDKAETYGLFREHYRREIAAVEKPEDFETFRAFVRKHPVFVSKQVYLAQGQSVELVDMNRTGVSEKEFFDGLIRTGKHVLEEKIVQTADMAAFNPSSVNTVRAITFNTRHGFRVPYCMIRTGRPGAFVDNSGAGGIQAEIDFARGTVVSDGFDESGNHYAAHPASGKVFKGFTLPDRDQMEKMIFSCAAKVPDIGFIGWDLAHTENGWVIVEGNENCYVIALQQIRDAGMRGEFETLMADMNLNA